MDYNVDVIRDIRSSSYTILHNQLMEFIDYYRKNPGSSIDEYVDKISKTIDSADTLIKSAGIDNSADALKTTISSSEKFNDTDMGNNESSDDESSLMSPVFNSDFGGNIEDNNSTDLDSNVADANSSIESESVDDMENDSSDIEGNDLANEVQTDEIGDSEIRFSSDVVASDKATALLNEIVSGDNGGALTDTQSDVDNSVASGPEISTFPLADNFNSNADASPDTVPLADNAEESNDVIELPSLNFTPEDNSTTSNVFIRNTNSPVKAIIVNANQFSKLSSSLAEQKKVAFSLSSSKQTSGEGADGKLNIEKMMEKAKSLYESGNSEEAEKLMATINEMTGNN